MPRSAPMDFPPARQTGIARRIMRKRPVIVSAVLAVAAAFGVGFVLAPTEPFDPLTDVASLCTSEQPFSVALRGEPRHRFEVTVPMHTPLPGHGDARSHAVDRGDIVQVRVEAPRGGRVAVHGVLNEHRVKVNDAIYVKLQLKHSGRFPLHFHGDDGSHFEVAVFEVRPQS